jgi:DNA repair protein RadC
VSAHDALRAEPVADTLANARRALERTRERRALLGCVHHIDGPGWEMLIDLYVHHLEGRQISVSALCVTSGLPMTIRCAF